jgi:hypothetical protein
MVRLVRFYFWDGDGPSDTFWVSITFSISLTRSIRSGRGADYFSFGSRYDDERHWCIWRQALYILIDILHTRAFWRIGRKF